MTLPESDSLRTAAALVDMPEGSIPEFGITIISFIDTEGDASIGFLAHGDVNLSSLIGLMAMVSHDMIHEADEDDA